MRLDFKPRVFGYQRLMIIIAALTLVCASLSCSPVEDGQNWRYEYYMSEAEKLQEAGEKQKAEKALLSAVDIAIERDWTNRVVGTRQTLAMHYLPNRSKFVEQLEEARTLCLQRMDCSGRLLRSNFNLEIWNRIFEAKDVDGALKLIDLAIENRDRLKDAGDFRDIVRTWTQDLRDGGFEKEAVAVQVKVDKILATLPKQLYSI